MWPAEQFKKCGITYEATDRPKSQLYVDLLPLINSSQIRLLDHARLEHQLINLERSTSRGGRDSVDHPPGGRDDVANSVAGVASLANRSTGLMSKLIANAFTDRIKPLW